MGGGYLNNLFPKKNKAFTLIELLAVIVVLAIIALIAVPIVLNLIEDTRKGAAESSARNYVKAVETYTVSSLMTNDKMKLNSNIKYKVAQEDKVGDILLNNLVEIKGSKPYGSEDYLKLDKKYNVNEGKLTFNDYIVIIENGEIVSASKVDKVYVNDIVLNYDNQMMEKGSTFQIIARIVPSDATDTRVTYKSIDETIASVDEKGIVTALKQGNTKIVVTSVDNPNIKKECDITVIISAKGLTLVDQNEQEITTSEIDQGKSIQINGLLEPNDVTTNALKWKSSDPKIAYVDENGLVYGSGVGEAVISAETINGIKKEVTIKVKKVIIDIERITIENASITVGNTLKLDVIMTSELDTETYISWTSSNEEIASIDGDGLVTAKKAGNITITASSGGKTATANIIVSNQMPQGTYDTFILHVKKFKCSYCSDKECDAIGLERVRYTNGVATSTRGYLKDSDFSFTGYLNFLYDSKSRWGDSCPNNNPGSKTMKFYIGDTRYPVTFYNGYEITSGSVSGAPAKIVRD